MNIGSVNAGVGGALLSLLPQPPAGAGAAVSAGLAGAITGGANPRSPVATTLGDLVRGLSTAAGQRNAEQLGKRLRKLRKKLREARGLRREELAAHARLSLNTVANIERGAGARTETLGAIAKALGVEIGDLFEREAS